VARGEAARVRTAHARHFAGREADILALWDSPRQHEAYTWFANELANLRAAFRWAADHGDLNAAAPIATYATLFSNFVQITEPIAWAEELIEPARAVDHPRLTSLYVMATWCWAFGRVEEAVRYSEAGQMLVLNGREAVPPGFESWLGGVHQLIGQPERCVEWCRRLLADRPDPYTLTAAGLVGGLIVAGGQREAIAVAKRLADVADALPNPWARTFALLMYGMACCDADPSSAREALRRGLVTARESGNRYNESHIANVLGRLEARYGDPSAALEHLSNAVHSYHDSGSFGVMRIPLAALAALLDKLGRGEPSATIAGYAFSSITKGWVPELGAAIGHLRDVLGDQAYEALAGNGESMTASATAIYAYEQIDAARAELERSP
jgi:tetratricopeptide (TPR) repeat protein